MILDACRNNPFESNWRSINRSLDLPVSGGLAKIQAPSGSLTAFSTTAGKQLTNGEELTEESTQLMTVYKLI